MNLQTKTDFINAIESLEARVAELEKKLAKKSKKMSHPTLEEVSAYFARFGWRKEHAHAFVDYYESNGWKVGRNPMKSWQAAVRNWIKTSKQKGLKPDLPKPVQPKEPEPDAQEKFVDRKKLASFFRSRLPQSYNGDFENRKAEEHRKRKIEENLQKESVPVYGGFT